MDTQLLHALERAHAAGRGYEETCRLAEAHPEQADGLFDFMEHLMLRTIDPSPVASSPGAPGRVADHLRAVGQSALAHTIEREACEHGAADPPAPGERYVDYARRVLGCSARTLQEGHEVPLRFIQEINAHPQQTPLGAIEELARRGARLGLDYATALDLLLGGAGHRQRRAASAPGRFHTFPYDYRRLVMGCFKDEPGRAFWLSFC